MGLFDWFRKQAKPDAINVKTNGEQASVAGLITKENTANLSLEEAEAIQKEVLRLLNENEVDQAMNYACRLLTRGSYEQSIDAFERIMNLMPNKKGVCENQIGAACFFLGKYEEAILHYLLSLQHGFDTSMLDYNVFEAAEEHYKLTGDSSLVEVYVERFPEGDAIEQAQRLL